LFTDIGNNELNYVYDANLLKVEQDHSYLVVYENSYVSTAEASTPVITKIVDDIIYFQAAKNHGANTLPDGSYSIYYGSDYIKYIQATPVTSNSVTSYEYIEYPMTTITSLEASPGYSIYYSATPPSIDLYDTEINKNSIGYYRLAYFNDGTDWINNLSKKVGSKIVGTFSGPNIKITGVVGPAYGKCKIRITTKYESSSETENIVLDWYEVDCYSTEEKESIIFQKNDLEYLDYTLEIETLSDKNILSANNQIFISKISFLRNFYFSLDDQEINPDLTFKSIGGLR
jgi:hypothetical protein